MRAILCNVVGIIASGLPGALAGRWLAQVLGLAGVAGALVAALVAMAVATAVWVGLTTLARKLGLEP